MENASRALLIAGTILISILIIGIFVYLFRAGGSLGETYDKKQTVEQLELYNSKFEEYTARDCTIMEIISLLNLAYNVNSSSRYDLNEVVDIQINVNGKKIEMPSTQNVGDKEVLLNSNVISIYDLTTKTLKELGLSSTGEDKLTETKLSTSDKTTIYKYLFYNTSIEYRDSNGKVSKMVFDMKNNY